MMLARARWTVLALALQAGSSGALAARAILVDEAALVPVLGAVPQCCVVDARSARQRAAAAIEGALPYTKQLRVRPTGTVVVVADDDARALSVAKAVARTSGHDVHALRGGPNAWHSVERELQAQAARPGASLTFVIPRNTCEQGEPLQILRSKPVPGASRVPQGAP
jgi:hypothetical protein